MADEDLVVRPGRNDRTKPGKPTPHEVRLILHEVEVEVDEEPKPGDPPREPGQAQKVKVKRQRPDASAIVTSAEAMVEAFLQERQDASLPVPEKQDILDRIAHLATNVSTTATRGINSAAENQRFYLVHMDTPPFFGVGTGK